jgi:hypothetical protein
MEGVNSTMIYCKHFCKWTADPQYKNNMIIFKKKMPNALVSMGESDEERN